MEKKNYQDKIKQEILKVKNYHLIYLTWKTIENKKIPIDQKIKERRNLCKYRGISHRKESSRTTK